MITMELAIWSDVVVGDIVMGFLVKTRCRVGRWPPSQSEGAWHFRCLTPIDFASTAPMSENWLAKGKRRLRCDGHRLQNQRRLWVSGGRRCAGGSCV